MICVGSGNPHPHRTRDVSQREKWLSPLFAQCCTVLLLLLLLLLLLHCVWTPSLATIVFICCTASRGGNVTPYALCVDGAWKDVELPWLFGWSLWNDSCLSRHSCISPTTLCTQCLCALTGDQEHHTCPKKKHCPWKLLQNTDVLQNSYTTGLHGRNSIGGLHPSTPRRKKTGQIPDYETKQKEIKNAFCGVVHRWRWRRCRSTRITSRSPTRCPRSTSSPSPISLQVITSCAPLFLPPSPLFLSLPQNLSQTRGLLPFLNSYPNPSLNRHVGALRIISDCEQEFEIQSAVACAHTLWDQWWNFSRKGALFTWLVTLLLYFCVQVRWRTGGWWRTGRRRCSWTRRTPQRTPSSGSRSSSGTN